MIGNARLGVIKRILVTFTSETKNGLNGLLTFDVVAPKFVDTLYVHACYR